MTADARADTSWGEWIYARSILKQEKFDQISAMLGELNGQRCLDLGSDNGIISLKLRELGGTWKSADIDPRSTGATSQLVGDHVYTFDGLHTPFSDREFDYVVVVDLLEHIPDERGFLHELNRILGPRGTLIVNVPYLSRNLLTRFRESLGLTDEIHGHIRSGYTPMELESLLGIQFQLRDMRSYTGSVSKFIDTVLVAVLSKISKPDRRDGIGRGLIVTDKLLSTHSKLARLYSATFPLIKLISSLDKLFFFENGYMLIAKATRVSGPRSYDRSTDEHDRVKLETASTEHVA